MAKQVLTSLNMNNNEIQNAVIQVLATAPASASIGKIYYDSTDNCLKQYDGSSWARVTTYPLDISITSNSCNNHIPSSKAVYDLMGTVDAMRFKGTLGTGGDITSLPSSNVSIGDTYRVTTAGTYSNNVCEVGDLFIATSTTPTWTVAQTNIEGAITNITGISPITVSGTGSNRTIDVATATGSIYGVVKVPANNGLSVTSGSIGLALATTASAGAMSAADKLKLNNIADQFIIYFYGKSTGEVQISKSYSEIMSMITNGAEVFGVLLTKSYDDLSLGDTDTYAMCSPVLASQDNNKILFSFRIEDDVILFDQDDGTIAGGGPGRFIISVDSTVSADDLLQTWDWIPDESYTLATSSSNGLMSSTDKAKLDGISIDTPLVHASCMTLTPGNTSVTGTKSTSSRIVNTWALADTTKEEVIVDTKIGTSFMTASIASTFDDTIHVYYSYILV